MRAHEQLGTAPNAAGDPDRGPTFIRLEEDHPERSEIIDLEYQRQRHIERGRLPEAAGILEQLHQRKRAWIEELERTRPRAGDDAHEERLDWLNQRQWAAPA
jgi:hypothetical protein